jgi:hypothetical protein
MSDVSSLDENPNCRSTHASFRLIGDRLVTAEVTRETGIAPTFASDKGTARPSTREGRQTITQRTGVWSLSSEGRLASTSLERHLIWLLDRIEPGRDPLRAAAEKYGATADFFCYWLSATGSGGPEVSPGTLARIAGLNASLGFDCYDSEHAFLGVS